MKTKVLVDADYFIYLAGRKYEDTIYWGDGILTGIVHFDKAKRWIDSQIKNIEDYLEADEMILYLSCPTEKTFRMKYNPDYKKDRFLKLRPLGYKRIRDYIQTKFKAVEEDGYEADDLIGIEANIPEENTLKIVVSVDKDFLSVPCNLVNPNHLERGLIKVEEEEAEFNFWIQVLAGDAADSYAGCPGVGPVTAKKTLDKGSREDWPRLVEALYLKKGLTRDDMLMNMRMAWILQGDDRAREIFKGETYG